MTVEVAGIDCLGGKNNISSCYSQNNTKYRSIFIIISNIEAFKNLPLLTSKHFMLCNICFCSSNLLLIVIIFPHMSHIVWGENIDFRCYSQNNTKNRSIFIIQLKNPCWSRYFMIYIFQNLLVLYDSFSYDLWPSFFFQLDIHKHHKEIPFFCTSLVDFHM